MKTNILIVIILILGMIASCKKVSVDKPEKLDYFMKLYGNYFNDRLNGVDITDDERIVLAGDRTLEEGEIEGWFIITDDEGMVQFERKYNFENDIRVFETSVNQSTYFIACEVNQGSSHNGWVVVYDENMMFSDSLSFTVDIETIKSIQFLEKSQQERFLLHGNNGSTDEVLIYEIGTDNGVHLISRNEMYGELEGRLYIFENSQSTIYMAGSVPEVAGQSGTGTSNIMVSRLDNDNIVWSYSIGDPGESELCAGIVFTDNQLFIGGSKKLSEEHYFADKLFIYKLNDYGQVAAIHDVETNGASRSFEMVLNGADELVWTGERKVDERTIRIFMARTTLNGQIKLEAEYGDRGYSSGRNITMLPGIERGFLISGILSTSGVSEDANDVLVIKVDKNGDWIH
jgi:hypothetical protein